MIVGIDLGTTFSLVAHVNHSGGAALVPDLHVPDRFQTPSLVHLGARGCLVGQLVEDLLEEEPGLGVCRFPKLAIGGGEAIYRDHQERGYDATAVSALILRKLKQDAEAIAGAPVEGCVITVPAHFNEAHRAATLNAGRLADLPVIALVDEPVAAATYFGMESVGKSERTIFVFDLGGGTLDATILQTSPNGLDVLATEGATNVGGKNFDDIIMDVVRTQYRAQFSEDCRHDGEAMERLRRFATRSKIALSAPACGLIRESLFVAGRSMRVLLTREQFEDAMEPWLEACVLECQRALEAIHLSWKDIDDLILTGGSSLIPCVERRMREVSGLPPDRVHRKQPHAAVAYGAALLAEQFHGMRRTAAPLLRQLVTGNELGLRAYDPRSQRKVFHSMIGKNTAVPASHRHTFFTRSAEQTMISVEVLQRKDAESPAELVGDFRFGPLADPAPGLAFEVEIGYDGSGSVIVSATDSRTGRSMRREFGGEAEKALNESYLHLRQLIIRS